MAKTLMENTIGRPFTFYDGRKTAPNVVKSECKYGGFVFFRVLKTSIKIFFSLVVSIFSVRDFEMSES